MAKKKTTSPRKKVAKKKPATRKKKPAKKKARKKTQRKSTKKAAPKRPRGRPRKPAQEKLICQGIRVDGQPCTAAATVGDFCGRHKDQNKKPAEWQTYSVIDIERRKQWALMRKRELEVAEQEGTLVDTSLAATEAVRLAGLAQDTIASVPARRSHEIAAELGVTVGAVAAVLERILREELEQIANSL